MTNETSHPTVSSLEESLAEESETMVFCTEELELADLQEVDEHEDELVDTEILGSYVPRTRNQVGVQLGSNDTLRVGEVNNS